ncbi:MAG TPA: DUF502 domain-containing protein [Gemmatimonadaceae bacterium]|nr:DUF502 domain-containing protein [Gemmatimonadaceae bacterium]
MRRLVNYFFRGVIVTAPIAVTAYVCYRIFVGIDSWLGLPVRGAGFAVTVVVITLTGFLASTILARSLVGALDSVMNRLPFVRLLYSSTRDLLNAFVGEQRRFDKPVLVTLYPGGGARAFGFVTQESLAHFGLADHVAVYLPQSYNFAGTLLVFPTAQVERVAVDSADVMAFIVSGGVAGAAGSPTPPRPPAAIGARAGR